MHYMQRRYRESISIITYNHLFLVKLFYQLPEYINYAIVVNFSFNFCPLVWKLVITDFSVSEFGDLSSLLASELVNKLSFHVGEMAT